jgi:cysteinyl-tRNA synthetase
VTLRLHDTAARAVREFRPVTPGRVSAYLCGATVRCAPHLGHLRAAVSFDIAVRWLEASGYEVTYCRGVTDIDDKILDAASAAGIPWWALAERNHRAFSRACDALGCRPPDAEPRASGHIPQMIGLTRRLVAGGHAYAAGGDICFDVRSVPGYGALSGRHLPGMSPGSGTGPGGAPGTRDPADFPLWKAARPGEPAWDSPWGPGRPGRHLACGAMASHYLGPVFDIHGGGADLVFPHHESERAQAAAAGDGFARYWLHHGLVAVAGEKMSDSLGNAIAADDALARARPQELRYYLGQAHYRSAIDYSEDALDEAAAAYQRIERFAIRAQRSLGAAPAPAGAADIPYSFTAAMDDDLCVPAALAAVHATVRDGNQALRSGDREGTTTSLAQVRSMLGVLGLDPLDPRWRGRDRDDRLYQAVDALVRLSLRQRESARARSDYASADSIQDTLEHVGIVIEDTPEGPRWELRQ